MWPPSAAVRGNSFHPWNPRMATWVRKCHQTLDPCGWEIPLGEQSIYWVRLVILKGPCGRTDRFLNSDFCLCCPKIKISVDPFMRGEEQHQRDIQFWSVQIIKKKNNLTKKSTAPTFSPERVYKRNTFIFPLPPIPLVTTCWVVLYWLYEFLRRVEAQRVRIQGLWPVGSCSTTVTIRNNNITHMCWKLNEWHWLNKSVIVFFSFPTTAMVDFDSSQTFIRQKMH